ncbi:MAG: hypothetical protein R6U96_06080 [Promethearchaeia archaeon]
MFAELKPGGGFINCSALGIPDEAKPENVRALIDYTREHGTYNWNLERFGVNHGHHEYFPYRFTV